MSDEMSEFEDTDHVAGLGGDLASALKADSVQVKLANGREVVGTLAGFSVRRKEKKGDVSWSGSVKIETDTGVLQVEFGAIASVAPR
jgi:hypothetical protein